MNRPSVPAKPGEPTLVQEDLGELTSAEIELIHLLRTKYRFGEVTIETREGQPTFVVQTIVRSKLG